MAVNCDFFSTGGVFSAVMDLLVMKYQSLLVTWLIPTTVLLRCFYVIVLVPPAMPLGSETDGSILSLHSFDNYEKFSSSRVKSKCYVASCYKLKKYQKKLNCLKTLIHFKKLTAAGFQAICKGRREGKGEPRADKFRED